MGEAHAIFTNAEYWQEVAQEIFDKRSPEEKRIC